jgi:hypothetical protein
MLVLAAASPAVAQYSHSSPGNALRSAPPQSRDKVAPNSRPNQPPPNLAGANRTGPQAAESRRTEGPPKPPVRFGTPLNNVPGQARAIPGMAR